MGMRRSVLLLAVVVLVGCGSAHKTAVTTTTVAPPARTPHRVPVHVVERAVGSLAFPVQDAAAVGGPPLLVGGLTPADVSTRAIASLHRQVGTLPFALHDAAAARLGGSVYLFGGGDGVAQHDEIQRVWPGKPVTVAHLPAASSDQAAAVVGGTAYVVGGYTGTRWLDTIVAWRPGAAARVVGRLPEALRYAAVAAVGGRVVIAGGSTPQGTASRSVLAFDPR